MSSESKNVRIAQEKREIFVNGYATPDITREQLARWADDLTYVSYYSYGYTMQGELVPIDDASLIQASYDSGVGPLMVLTPFDENGQYSYELVRVLFTDPRVRDRLINNVVMTVTNKNYLGFIFNFGYIAPEDSEEFVVTVAKTAARLNRRGNLVIVSLTPGINDEGINYESLGRAANFLELRMFHWEQVYEAPGPVSPVDRARELLSVITAKVNPRAILLGISNYGYVWTLPYGAAAERISQEEAAERAIRAGVPVEYDEIVQAPHYSYTTPEGVNQVVWYEDERSVRAKLSLVDEFNLSGISIWTIMNPFPAAIAAIDEMFLVFKI